MLRKLIKWEFAATWRVMLALLGGLLVLSLAACLGVTFLDRSPGLVITGAISVVAYFLAVMAAGTATVVLLVYRFYKSLLSNEGYLSFSIPASVHAQIWAKLITGAVWIIAAFLAIVLSIVVAAAPMHVAGSVLGALPLLLDHLAAAWGVGPVELATLAAGILLAAFLSSVGLCLSFYAAMGVGFGFSEHKALASVLVFLGIGVITQIATTAVAAGAALVFYQSGGGYSVFHVPGGFALELTAAIGSLPAAGYVRLFSLALFAVTACQALYCAALYALAAWSLKRRLNLP